MATIYRSTDAGVPAWPTTITQGAKFVIDVLKACLVNGYGSQTAAGWSIVYEDTTAGAERIAFTNGNGVIEFVSWNDRSLGMFIWDSITTPGTGAIYKDTWPDLLSQGVNGWQGELVEVGASSNVPVLMANNLHFSAYQYWQVYADDKSVWLSFEYPDGSSQAEPSDVVSRYTYVPIVFFGAVKSPDLTRNEAGNFFLSWGATSSRASSNPSVSTVNKLQYIWGLRTPMGTLPTSGNASDFSLGTWSFDPDHHNHLSSVRPVLPILISYDGADTPKSPNLSNSYRDYQFATLPGFGWFADVDQFWKFYNTENSASWNIQEHTIGGEVWQPTYAFNAGSYGLTANPDWWT